MPRAPLLPAAPRGGAVGSVREANLIRILGHLRDRGPSSRQDIADGCGLGVSTMTDLVGELRLRRLVRELDGVPHRGAGRPMRPIALDGEPWCVLGVEVDVLGVSFLGSTVGGRELWSDHVPARLLHSGPVAGWALLQNALGTQLGRLPARTTLVAVEIGLPGYVASDRGTVGWSASLGWEDLPLRRLVAESLAATGSPGVAVGIAHDCHLAALHAVRVELGRPVPGVAVYLGGMREVGGAAVVGGQIFRGADGGAGDFGHANIDPRGPECPCGRRGCLESLIGPTTLLSDSGLTSVAEAHELVTLDPASALGTLLAAADAGDRRVLEVLDRAGDALGVALDDVIGTVNPHVVILGGYLGVLQTYLLGPARHRIAHRTSLPSFAATTVIALGEAQARVVAGATLAARDACLADPLAMTTAAPLTG